MISGLLVIFLLINVIFFFVLLLKSIANSKDKKYESIQKAEVGILAIAFTQYAVTLVIENSNVLEKDSETFAQQLRYVDWLITTPLLLYTYWKLAEVEGYTGDLLPLIYADLWMIILGIIAEIFVKDFKIKLLCFILSSLGYAFIIIKIIDIMNFFNDKNLKRQRNLGWFFIIGWLIYPIGFFFGDEVKYILYSIGDFINKGLYSISLTELL